MAWKPGIFSLAFDPRIASISSAQFLILFFTKAESAIVAPETQSVFHRHAQRNAFRHRGAHPQSRLFARENPRLTRSPNSNRLS